MHLTMINVFICSPTLVECYQLVNLICCLFIDVSCLMDEIKIKCRQLTESWGLFCKFMSSLFKSYQKIHVPGMWQMMIWSSHIFSTCHDSESQQQWWCCEMMLQVFSFEFKTFSIANRNNLWHFSVMIWDKLQIYLLCFLRFIQCINELSHH